MINKTLKKLFNKIIDSTPAWIGVFEIKVYNISKGTCKKKIIFNRIMNTGLDQLSETLLGNATDLEIKYLAVGTDNTPITDTDTQLGAEIFRTPPQAGPTKLGTGTIETEFILLDNEAVGSIREVGIFVGSTATSTVNTGTLLTRILWNYEKSNSEEIIIKRIDRIVRS